MRVGKLYARRGFQAVDTKYFSSLVGCWHDIQTLEWTEYSLTYVYVGQTENGQPNGQGTKTTYRRDRSLFGVYVGGFKDGKEHGQGVMNWDDGAKFIGEFRNGRRWEGNQYDSCGNLVSKKNWAIKTSASGVLRVTDLCNRNKIAV